MLHWHIYSLQLVSIAGMPVGLTFYLNLSSRLVIFVERRILLLMHCLEFQDLSSCQMFCCVVWHTHLVFSMLLTCLVNLVMWSMCFRTIFLLSMRIRVFWKPFWQSSSHLQMHGIVIRYPLLSLVALYFSIGAVFYVSWLVRPFVLSYHLEIHSLLRLYLLICIVVHLVVIWVWRSYIRLCLSVSFGKVYSSLVWNFVVGVLFVHRISLALRSLQGCWNP
jgi:hypothetical protein